MKDGKLRLELASEAPNLDIYYTIDDTIPDQFSTHYTQPVDLLDGPINLRVIMYQAGKPIGHLIRLSRDALQKRVGR